MGLLKEVENHCLGLLLALGLLFDLPNAGYAETSFKRLSCTLVLRDNSGNVRRSHWTASSPRLTLQHAEAASRNSCNFEMNPPTVFSAFLHIGSAHCTDTRQGSSTEKRWDVADKIEFQFLTRLSSGWISCWDYFIYAQFKVWIVSYFSHFGVIIQVPCNTFV